MNDFLLQFCYNYFIFLFPIIILYVFYCFRENINQNKTKLRLLIIASVLFVPELVIFYILLLNQGYTVLAAGINGVFLALLYCGLAYDFGKVLSWRFSLSVVFLMWLNSYLALACSYTAFDVFHLFQTASLDLDITLLLFMAKVIALLVLSRLCRKIIRKNAFVHKNDDKMNIQEA